MTTFESPNQQPELPGSKGDAQSPSNLQLEGNFDPPNAGDLDNRFGAQNDGTDVLGAASIESGSSTSTKGPIGNVSSLDTVSTASEVRPETRDQMARMAQENKDLGSKGADELDQLINYQRTYLSQVRSEIRTNPAAAAGEKGRIDTMVADEQLP